MDVASPITTVGIDLAAEPRTTAVAVLDWDGVGVTVRSVTFPATDNEVVAQCEGAAKIGIDCPFGWPAGFVDFVVANRNGWPVTPAGTIQERRPLAYRATDVHCRAEFGMRPLSVSADRIAHAAFRCAALLPRLDANTDRSGAARVIETYPAGSLRRWGGFVPTGYKGPTGTRNLAANMATLHNKLPLTFTHTADERAVTTIDHAFDAVIAAITARVAMLGLVEEIPPQYRERARVEGWIAVPLPDSLDALEGHERTS